MESSIYIAKQPIVNTEGEVFAYELFYRRDEINSAEVDNDLYATARLLVNTLNYIGLHSLVGDKMAFIKVDKAILMNKIIYSISPSYFILEILETTVIDEELLKRIDTLKKDGYIFALNHYDKDVINIHSFKELMHLVSYVKLYGSDIEAFRERFSSIDVERSFRAQLITEKVENAAEFKRASEMGIGLFQGYFFSKPELFGKDKIEPPSSLLMLIIYLLESNAKLERIINIFNTSPYLTLNLLKFIHMHKGFAQKDIASIEQALIVIGRVQLQSWLELMIHASSADEGQEEFAKELRSHAQHRAILMTILARKVRMSESNIHTAYMIGLLSMSEVIFQSAFDDIVKEVDLDKSIENALVDKSGQLGELLQLISAVEQNDSHKVTAIIAHLGLSQNDLNSCLLESYQHKGA
ncbi:MAG: EAL domain-containing protein [Campylobacterota bacterium]|nr:EAL domain-containing protein [Campylobacterota bacterium]